MSILCGHCNKTFKRESSIVAHMCKQKARYLNKDKREEKLALHMFVLWTKRSHGAINIPNLTKFINSHYYIAFYKFAKYIIDVRVISPEAYLHWLIEHKVKVDKWATDAVYSEFLVAFTKQETPERAVERFVLHTSKWAEENSKHWSDYWDDASIHLILHDITMGKISPWILLAVPTAKDVLLSFPEEMIDKVSDAFDIIFWSKKVNADQESANWVKEILS